MDIFENIKKMPYIYKPKKQKNNSIKREERQAVYATRRWRKLRLAKLMQSPLCEKCLQKGITNPAIDIHHIDSFLNYEGLKRIEKAYDINNLMSICKECHQKEHNSQSTEI